MMMPVVGLSPQISILPFVPLLVLVVRSPSVGLFSLVTSSLRPLFGLGQLLHGNIFVSFVWRVDKVSGTFF